MRDRTEKRGSPGPRGLERLSASFALMIDPLGALERAKARYGDVVQLKMGRDEAFLVSDPALIEKIFISEHQNYVKDVFTRKLGALWGEGLLSSEGEEWKRQRFLVQPPFQHRHFERYGASIVSLTERFLSTWKHGETRDVHDDMMRLTLEIVAATLFGSELDPADIAEIGGCLEAIMDYAYFIQGALTFTGAPDRIPVPSRKRFRDALRRFDAVIAKVVQSHPRDSGDLLSLLLSAHDQDPKWMTQKLIRDELSTLFLAGHETTALALTFVWHLLSRHPEPRSKVQAEIETVLGGRVPQYSDVAQLKYCEAVIKEAMRLFPPVWITGREAARECRLGGHALRRGDQILLCQWIVQRDERWFSDALSFRPERWEGASFPRFAYFPFGGGPRICIGNNFAMMEATLILALVAQRFQLDETERTKPLSLIPSITIRPKGGLPVSVTELRR